MLCFVLSSPRGCHVVWQDVYTFMEDPDTLLSHAFSAFIMGVIVLSVITMVVESLPQYAHNPVSPLF